MTDQETQQQIHDLTQEIIAVQALIAAQDAVAATEQAMRAFEVSPPHALFAMASFTAMRFERVRQLTIPPEETNIEFPHGALSTVPNNGRPDLVDQCIDLAESIWRESADTEIVDSLLAEADGGAAAFMILLAISLKMGHAVVQFDDQIDNLQQLIAQEGVETEAAWLRRGGSYDEPG